MGIKTNTSYECDRCGNTAKALGDDPKPPTGWAEVSINEYILPASQWQDEWFDYELLICANCMETLAQGAAYKIRAEASSAYKAEYEDDDED